MELKDREAIKLNKQDQSVVFIFITFIFGLIAILGYFGYFDNQNRDSI